MKQEVSPVAMIGGIIVALAIAGFFIFRAVKGDVSSQPSEMGQQLSKVMARTSGDVSQMTADERKIYDKALTSGYYRPRGMSGSAAAYGGAPGSSEGPHMPGMAGSSGTSGGYPGSSGSSGGYPGSSGSSGGYPGSSGGQ